VSYFEQSRGSLDPQETLLRTLCPAGDQVIFRGKPIHIRSYLDRFLFPADRMEQPIGSLSGGEQARVLIAKLMLSEANLLVLDEPTNDLDLMTLNVLQDCLTEFDGAVILVSHDRFFLDQVSTKILAFPFRQEEKEKAELLFFENLAQWEDWHRQPAASLKKPIKESRTVETNPISKPKPINSDQIIKKIERKEVELTKLQEECSKPELSQNYEQLGELGRKIAALQAEIDELYSKI
jgi:ATP-binding cassette subfamily F protein uup